MARQQGDEDRSPARAAHEHRGGYPRRVWCGFLFQQFGATGTTGFNIWSLFVAFVGAVVLLVVIRLLTGRLKFLPKQQRTTRLW
jgi:hypothetical protein